jgi:hypothetical protein
MENYSKWASQGHGNQKSGSERIEIIFLPLDKQPIKAEMLEESKG